MSDPRRVSINGFGEARDGKRAVAGIIKSASDIAKAALTAEPAVVHSYDFASQRVNVILKNHPQGPIIYSVPIMLAGADLRVVVPMKTIAADGEGNATSGLLVYPTSDSTLSYRDRDVKPPNTTRKQSGLAPVFIPGLPILDANFSLHDVYDVTATSTDYTKIAPGEGGLFHESGSAIIFKGDGSIAIITAPGKKLYYNGDEVDTVGL